MVVALPSVLFGIKILMQTENSHQKLRCETNDRFAVCAILDCPFWDYCIRRKQTRKRDANVKV
jgi:hypothetical protein